VTTKPNGPLSAALAVDNAPSIMIGEKAADMVLNSTT